MVPHPGEILKREIAKRSMSMREFAQFAGLPQSSISMIITKREGIGKKTAEGLGRATNISADKWLFLWELYLEEHPRTKHPNVLKHETRILNAYKKL